METDGSLVTKDSFDSHHDPKATAVDAEEDREPEGFSGTFLIASPAAFKTDRSEDVMAVTPAPTPLPQRQVSSASRGSASCRLLPLWHRIFRLRRSAGGKGAKSKKLRNASESDAADESPAAERGSHNSSSRIDGEGKTLSSAAGTSEGDGRGDDGSSFGVVEDVVGAVGTGEAVGATNSVTKKMYKSSCSESAKEKLIKDDSRCPVSVDALHPPSLPQPSTSSAAYSNCASARPQLSRSSSTTSSSAMVVPMSECGAEGDEKTLECPLCLTVKPWRLFPHISTCSHRSCLMCIKHYLRIEISEARTNICCPECVELFHPTDIQQILQDDRLMAKFEDFTLRRHLANEPDCRWCPAPDCGFAVIATGCASCPQIECQRQGCNISFCYHCKQEWHPETTCDEARNLRRRSPGMAAMLGTVSDNRRPLGSRRRNWGNDPGPIYRSMFPLERAPSISSRTSLAGNDIKSCPRCSASIIKMDDGSCNHITCAVCGAEFCWLCMREISDLHYLSPSGCTFWGKKPWSRKKKIFWQLSTLVGAPVGIALIAGIAVPAIVIGVPVWVGRKMYARHQELPRHRRNLRILGGVSASVLVSPVLAAVAVGVGVPILLAYVYGVVPISLCRAGGCGVSTSSSGGVKFDFDDDEEDVRDNINGISAPPIPDNQSADVSHMGTIGNPSIGDDSAVLIPSHQGEDNDSQVAGLVLGPSIGEAITSRVNVDPSPHRARNSVASRHDNLVGESASTTGVVPSMGGRSGVVGASFAGLSALGDSASYADSILAETVSASSAPVAAVAGPQQQSFHHPNRLEVLADVSASMQSGMSGGGACGGAVGGVGAGSESLGTGNLKGAVGGASTGGGSGGKRASVSSSAGSTSFTFACDSKSATVSFHSEGEAASTRALAGSILSRNDRDRDSGLGTPQPGQMEVQADILTNPSISSYRFGNGSVTSFSNNNSRRGSLGSGLAPDDGRPAQENASIASNDGALEASGASSDDHRVVAASSHSGASSSRLAGPSSSRFLDVVAPASIGPAAAAGAAAAAATLDYSGDMDAFRPGAALRDDAAAAAPHPALHLSVTSGPPSSDAASSLAPTSGLVANHDRPHSSAAAAANTSSSSSNIPASRSVSFQVEEDPGGRRGELRHFEGIVE